MTGAIILGLIAVACMIFGIRSLMEKGPLFNNAWLYASQLERSRMNKKPYYQQTGIVFIIISLLMAVNAVEMLLMTGWMVNIVVGLAVVGLIYAIVSSVMIERNKNVKK